MTLLLLIAWFVCVGTAWPDASQDARLIFVGLVGILCVLERWPKPPPKDGP